MSVRLVAPLTALALLCVCVGPGHAQSLAPRAALEEGTRLYHEGDVQRAEAFLRIAVAGLAEAPLRARAWVVLALVHASRKNLAATRDALRAALTEDPEPAFDRATVAPDVVAMFDSVRADLFGEVRLLNAGETPHVFLGDRELGRGSTVRAPIGRHRVRVLAADGHRAFEASDVVVRVNRPALVRVAYTRLRGRVRIVGPWRGATLRAGAVVATLGDEAVVLYAGPQLLTLERGAERAQVHVVVRAERVTDVIVAAQRPAPTKLRRRTWGFIAMGASAAVAVLGGVLGVLARGDANEIGGLKTWDMARYDALKTGAEQKALAANVLFGLAGAGALTGLLLALTDRGETAPRRARVVPSLHGLGLALDVRF